MRIPLFTGLLLVSAWTTHAQTSTSQSALGAAPGTGTAATTQSATATTSSVVPASNDVFLFHDVSSGSQRIYYAVMTPDPRIDISTTTPNGMIQLYIRNNDGDTVIDNVSTASNTTSKNGYMENANVDNKPTIILHLATVVSKNQTGHAFFFALQTSELEAEGLSGSQTIYSPYFGVLQNLGDQSNFDGVDLSTPTPATVQTGSSSASSAASAKTAASNSAFNTAASSPSSKGLATGAIAGIAVGAVVVLIIIIAAIWFMIRRRGQQARSHTADATTPLAAGYGRVAAAAGSRDLIAEKEAGAMVAESPRTQTYTDHFDPRHSATLSGAVVTSSSIDAPATASYPERGHQAYDDVGRSLTDPQPPHGSASSSRGLDSPVPDIGVTRHLVDDDMTADEIARLEEEERELDRQIQQAGRRRR